MARPASTRGSSTSARRRSPNSPPSTRASSRSTSAGDAGASALSLTPGAVRSIAASHGIRPRKSLGQNFLIEPALARRIAELAGVGPGDRVLEVGAGLGSLTVALARAGARVVAVEVDRTLVPALEAVVRPFRGSVRVSVADMLGEPWDAVLGPEPVPWTLVANLPYNVAVPLVVRALDEEPRIGRMLVMVQQEVGERLAAGPGDPQYGAVSVHVAFHARARVVRHVPPTVFWPRPSVESVLVSIDRRPPPADVDRDALFAVIRESFAQRRKTMRGALRRLGLGAQSATDALEACGVRASARPEEVSLDAFVCVSRQWLARRGRVSGDR